MHAPAQNNQPSRVVIIGGGFAGLNAAKSLAHLPPDRARVTLIDRTNHHLFQPLLYQVATASLNPSDIAAPIRHVLRRQKNLDVVLGEVTAIDTARRVVRFEGGEAPYDYLVVAAGATHSYFGNEQWSRHAPGLKNIGDAIQIRDSFLLSFEAAELESDPQLRRAILTFVVVGAGPTGVELAGAMAEIARRAIPRDFRRIDTTAARIILIEGGPRVLPTYSEDLSRRAKADLERLGVEVWVGTRVTSIDARGLHIGDERISTRNVYWAAGVKASTLGAMLGAPTDHAGRVAVCADLSVPGHPEVFVAGDLAMVVDPATNAPVPGVAPAAMQMGRHTGRLIARAIESGGTRSDDSGGGVRPAFRYLDKGMLATIGRAKAVGTIGRMKATGLMAWTLWMGIHITYLIGFRNRLVVLINWAWAYIRFERGARLIARQDPRRLAELRSGAKET